jgi:hypothetical protein
MVAVVDDNATSRMYALVVDKDPRRTLRPLSEIDAAHTSLTAKS